MKYIVITLLLIAAFAALRYFISTLDTKAVASIVVKDGESFLADCPNSPNCQSSEATRQSQLVDRFVLTKDSSQSIATLAQIVGDIPGMEVVQFNEKYLHATATTSLLRFVDDVEFLLSDDNQSIQVRSASRLGKSDLGANAKRISAIRAAAEGNL